MYNFLPVDAGVNEIINAKTETSLIIQINEYLLRKYQDAPACDREHMQIRGIRVEPEFTDSQRAPLSNPVYPLYGDERDTKVPSIIGYLSVTSRPTVGTTNCKLVYSTTPADIIDHSTDPRDSFKTTRELIKQRDYHKLFTDDPNGLMVLRMIQGCDLQTTNDNAAWLQTRIDLYLAAKWFFHAIGITSCDEFTEICEYYKQTGI